MKQKVTKAVILAAGQGTRYRKKESDLPKPLTQLGGLSLLERTVRMTRKAGISEWIIITGFQGDIVRGALEKKFKDLNVHWVQNDDWQLGNGNTVLKAKPLVGDDKSLVLMSDHIFFTPTMKSLIEVAEKNSTSVMAIDRKINSISDLDDSMKVTVQNSQVTQVNKKLTTYDAIDIGATVVTPDFYTELEKSSEKNGGKCSHFEGMHALATQGKLQAHDIETDVWEDVDTPEAYQAAKKLLFNSLRKKTDGWASQFVERNISLTLTKILSLTPIRPNHVSLFVACLGMTAGYLFAQEGTGIKIGAAVLFWVSSFLDGCDGELARLKYLESRLGGWLDLWVDNIIHISVFTGMGIGLYRDSGEPHFALLGGVASVGVLLSVGWVSFNLARAKKKEGPLYTSVVVNDENVEKGKIALKLKKLADALSRRDFIPFVIIITALGYLPYFLWATAIGSNIYFLVIVALHFAGKKANA